MKKRGIMGMSFGVMFSIFLIIVFIFFAIKIIGIFLDVNDCFDVASFSRDFQEQIDNARMSSSTSQEYTLNMDGSVEKLCFFDSNSPIVGKNPGPKSWTPGDNAFAIQDEGCDQASNYEFDYLNITKITESENPKCFDNKEIIIIKKSINSRLIDLE